MDADNLERNLICIKFPGIVKNDDKAIECLGGIRGISEVYSDINRKRFALSFQPDNPFISKTFSDPQKTSGVLIKVKVKKTKSNGTIKREVVSTSVIGKVQSLYKFESMCDFQFLPIHRESKGSKTQCIWSHVIPSGVDNLSYFDQPAISHIVPQNFSRTDKPFPYHYSFRKLALKEDEDGEIVGDSKKAPGMLPVVFSLTADFPTEPCDLYVQRLKSGLKHGSLKQEDVDKVRQMFEERPIWSQNAIYFLSKINRKSLKIIVPNFSFNCGSGPWYKMWIRYGYDPRKDPNSRFYQTLDFRIRTSAGQVTVNVQGRRTESILYRRQMGMLPTSDADQYMRDIKENKVFFRPGMVPAQRQIYYQYCDIKVPEVEEVVGAAPAAGMLCHPQRGWLAHGVDELCRQHILRYARQAAHDNRVTTPNDGKFEKESSAEDQSTDEESATEADDATDT